LGGEINRQVKHGALEARHRDPVEDRVPQAGEVTGRVTADAHDPVRAGRRDVDRSAADPPYTVQGGSGAMAEASAVSAGEDRRHPAPMGAEACVADRIDPAVDAQQPLARHEAEDLVLREAQAPELTPAHDTVLARRQHAEAAPVCGN
jgi:hypothetical protein